jgi:hypothetical protein
VAITGFASDNEIGALVGGGNLISGNRGAGVLIDGAHGNRIFANYIGVDAAGSAALPNTVGVLIIGGSSDTVIGGSTQDLPNVISGNAGPGIVLGMAQLGGATSTVVSGNLIGTNAGADQRLGNGGAGIIIELGGSNEIGTFAGGNVISANAGAGIVIGAAAPNNRIGHNWIGSTLTFGEGAPLQTLGNSGAGISISSSGNQIGGFEGGGEHDRL